MRQGRWKLGIGILLCVGAVSGGGGFAHGDERKQILEPLPGSGRVFLYTARKLGVPILKASIKLKWIFRTGEPPLRDSCLSVDSLRLGFLFRMNNRFLSIVQAKTCAPVRYVKEIDQEGLFVGGRKTISKHSHLISR